MKKLSSRGFTLVELMIAVTIMATMAAGVMQARYFMAQQTQKNSDKAFATEKAIQMMEELRTLVNSANSVNVLDSYGDTVTISGGNSVTVFNPILTTDQSVTTATNTLSGNLAIGTGYKFYRFIQIVPAANDPTVRTVSVQVFASNPNNQVQAGQELAQVTSVLRTNSTVFQPSQTLDVYVLALNNVLGWFTTVPEMADTFGQAVTDLHTRNPALNFRMHVIDQTGFGRDPYYKPFINDTNFADTSVMPCAYFYPGWDHETSGTDVGGDEQFFADTGSSGLQSVGNVLDDDAGGATEAVTTTGFSIADSFNNDVRWPDEQLDYAVLTTNAVASGLAAPQITLRMLLEEMNSEPQSFTNAIIVSMHGEVLPLPPMRNYSDPAKDPYNNPNVRVVTHPERIYYPNTTPAGVNLRVYAYVDGLEKSQPISTFTSNTAATISLVIPGINLSTAQMSVDACYGGIYPAGTTTGYAWDNGLAVNTAVPAGAPMSWTESGGSSGTTIFLFNTPLRCPQYTGTGGLKYSGLPELLYGTEYISCPTTASATLTSTSQATNYTPDLSDTTNSATKAVNTARWVIHILPNNLPNGQAVTFLTSLGPLSYASTVLGSLAMPVSGTGTTITYSEDLSKTYTWIGNGTKAAAPPFTEQFQFNGDPRDCPYYDVKCGYNAGAADPVVIAAGGYNWYFKNLSGNPDGFSGFSSTQNTYQGGSVGGDGDIRDMPRYYYLYRNAILSTESIFTNLNGYTCWHAGEGGEFGDTYDNWSGSLPFLDTPWNPEEAVTTKVTISEVQKQGGCFSYKIGATTYNGPGLCTVAKDDGSGPNNAYTGGNWWAESWRGELFPDDQFSNTVTVNSTTVGWIVSGNLPVGKNKFYRLPIAEIQNTTNSLDGFPNPWYGHDVGGIGPADFLGGVSSGSVTSTPMGFMHTTGNTGNSVLTNMGFNLYSLANFPLASPVSCTRPWGDNVNLTTNGTLPTEWTSPFYQKLATTLSYPQYGSPTTLQQFYDASSFSASPFNNAVAGMQMNYPTTSPTQSAFYVFSGLAPQANFPQLDLAETGLICSLRSYLDAGLYTGINHITQLPLIQIYTPLPAQDIQSGSVSVSWGPVLNAPSLWERWGAASYTEQYPVTWTEPSDPTVVYNVKFNVGCTGNSIANCPCSFVNDFTAAQLGVFNSSEAVTATSMTFNVSTLPRGYVDVIVEAYRQSADTEGSGSVTVGNYYPLHYSWHAVQFYNY